MKKLLLVGIAALSVFYASRADANDLDFKTYPSYTLGCELDPGLIFARPNDHPQRYLALEVVPSEMVVKVHSDTFSITRAIMNLARAVNRFGNVDVVPFVQLLNFQQVGGRTHTVSNEGRYVSDYYMPDLKDSKYLWQYRCVPF